MDKIINKDLILNPYNWIIVVLMMATAALAIKFVFVASNSPQNVQA